MTTPPRDVTGYLRAATIAKRLTALVTAHPDLVTKGTGWVAGHEGRVPGFVKIRASNPTSAQRWRVLLLGGVHARELAPPDALLSFVEKLLTAYETGTDVSYPAFTGPDGTVYDAFTVGVEEARAVIDRLDLYVCPLVNPDGRDYALVAAAGRSAEDIEQHRLWRKNRRPAPTGETSPDAVGVDVNRNFDILWDFRKHYDSRFVKDLAVSASAVDEVFAGPKEESEPETRNVAGLMRDEDINYVLDVHSFSRDVLYTWTTEVNQSVDATMTFRNAAWDGKRDGARHGTYSEYIPPGTEADAKALADRVALLIKTRAGGSDPTAQRRSEYLVKSAAVGLYAATGTTMDYNFSRWFLAADAGTPIRPIIGMTIEAGVDPRHPVDPDDRDGEFWPDYRTQYPKIEREIHAGVWAFLTGVAANPVQPPSAPPLPVTSRPPSSGPCLVATTVYADAAHPSVVFLRDVRDRQVPATAPGRRFAASLDRTYRAVSPPMATWLTRHPLAVTALRRGGLDPMVRGLRALSGGATGAPRTRSLLLSAILAGTVWPALLVARCIQQAARLARRLR
jgi:hypothetical protein